MSKYQSYLDGATKDILSVVSSSYYAYEEKEEVVSGFVKELNAMIIHRENFQDPQYLIATLTLTYLDKKISGTLRDPNASVQECLNAIELCDRMEETYKLFTQNKWPIPTLQLQSPQNAHVMIAKKARALSVTSEIKMMDTLVSNQIKKASISLSVTDCDDAEESIFKLQQLVEDADKEKIAYSGLTNSNFDDCRDTINSIRFTANKKADTDTQMLDLDKKIVSAETKPGTDNNHWDNSLALCEKQAELISMYRTKGWKLPPLTYDSYVLLQDVRQRFLKYKEITSVEKDIRNVAETAKTEIEYNTLLCLCGRYKDCIAFCTTRNWKLPEGIISDDSKLISDARTRINAETKKRKLAKIKQRIILITTGIALIGILVLYITVFVPLGKYNQAIGLMNNGDFEKAKTMFAEMEDYRDASTRIKQVEANEKFAKGDLEGAYLLYSQLGDKYNNHAADYQHIYSQAETYLSEGSPNEALDLFLSLGEYNNSNKRAQEVGLSIAQSLIEKQNYEEAATIYEKIGSFEAANNSRYLYANQLANDGHYIEASTIWLSIPNFSDSRKRNYDLAVSIKDSAPETAVAILNSDIEYNGAKQALYDIATTAAKNNKYEFAISTYDLISEYKDSKSLITSTRYNYACYLKEHGNYEKAATIFAHINNYKDSGIQWKDCLYIIAEDYVSKQKYQEALKIFTAITGYKDSEGKAKYCNYYIAAGYKQNKNFTDARAIYLSLGNYLDSPTLASECGYNQAKAYMTEKKYAEAAILFEELGDYEESTSFAKESRYLQVKDLIAEKDYISAIPLLVNLGEYKDSVVELGKTRLLAAEKYEEANDFIHALEIYEQLVDYDKASEKVKEMNYRIGTLLYNDGNAKDAMPYLEKAMEYPGDKELMIKIASDYVKHRDYASAEKIYLVIGNYNDALKGLYDLGSIYESQGDDVSAAKLFAEAGNYKDAKDRKTKIANRAQKKQMIQSTIFAVGNTLMLGKYEQDGKNGNGKEPIEWIIVDKEGSRVLLVAKYAIDRKEYRYSKEEVTWKSSSIRVWLNREFISNAFTDEQKKGILETEVSNQPTDGYKDYSTYGPDTKDRVFLLSYYEIKKYFPDDESRKLKATTYTKNHGAEFRKVFGHYGYDTCYWLTRSPGKTYDEVLGVQDNGAFYSTNVDDEHMGIRPAFWFDSECAAAQDIAFALGSTVTFGQFGDLKNNTLEPLRWIVIEKQNDTVTLLAEKIIDNRRFVENRKEGITWADSDLRKWLNNGFLLTAFNSDELKAMCNVRYELNSKDGVDGYYQISSQELTDRVYLLSYNSVQKVYPNTDDRKGKSTPYAKRMGAGDNSCWWMISPGSDNISVAVIDENGNAGTRWATDKRGVRPVIMISQAFGLE